MGIVVTLGHQLAQRRRVRRQGDLVANNAGRVRVEAGHHGAARGRADWLRAITILENETSSRQRIHMTRVDPFIAIGRHGIVSLLVGEDEKNIRSGDGHVRAGFPYRLIKKCLNTGAWTIHGIVPDLTPPCPQLRAFYWERPRIRFVKPGDHGQDTYPGYWKT